MKELQKRVSDIITKEEISKWIKGEVITIKAGTGAGKSYWCKNVLYQYAKEHGLKILMLVPRVTCRDQFINDLKEAGKQVGETITVKTYQKLECECKSNDMNLDYDYIVCDEVYYYVADSQFNYYTDLTFKPILKSKATKILMSATIDFMVKYLEEKMDITPKKYELPIHFNNFKNVHFYTGDETIETILKLTDLVNKEDKKYKALVYVNSLERQLELYNNYGGMFYCSPSNKDYSKYNDDNKIDKLKLYERFDDNFLFTNKVMDMGTNLKDRDLKVLIIDKFWDINDIIQFLGRKRKLDDDDMYDSVYIRYPSNKELNGYKDRNKTIIEEVEYLLEYGNDLYVEKYDGRGKHKNPCIYDGFDKDGNTIKVVNDFAYYNYKLEQERIEHCINNYGFYGYVVESLGLKKGQHSKWNLGVIGLKEYLKINVGKVMLTKEDREELIKEIGVKDSHGKLLKGINTLNGYLEETNLPYRILQLNRVTKTIDGKKKNFKSPWKIVSLDEEE